MLNACFRPNLEIIQADVSHTSKVKKKVYLDMLNL